MGGKHVDPVEAELMINFLPSVLAPNGETSDGKKKVRYLNGYSDAKVAEELSAKHNRHITESHVGKFRLKLHGSVRSSPDAARSPRLPLDLAAVELKQSLARIEAKCDSILRMMTAGEFITGMAPDHDEAPHQ